MTPADLKLEIERYQFAAHDMQLYLDTHPDDKKAFAVYKSLLAKTLELKAEYAKKIGPLKPADNIYTEKYEWIKGPWPWEKGGNA